MYHIMSFMSPGFGGVQIHLRVRSYCLDPHEQQPLHARHQGGGGADGGGDDKHPGKFFHKNLVKGERKSSDS